MKVGFLQTNCYILSNDRSEAVIIDPGSDSRKIINYLNEHTHIPKAILITHTHFDHVGAIEDIMATASMNLYISAKATNNRYKEYAIAIDEGDTIVEAEMEFLVLATPGHSKDSVCFLYEDYLFTGDTLFHMSVGRTDFEGGDIEDQKRSLKRIKELGNKELKILAGHMEETTLSYEIEHNTFLR